MKHRLRSTLGLLVSALLGALSCAGDPPVPGAPATPTSPRAADPSATRSPPPAAAGATTVKRVVISLSRASGTCVTTRDATGTVREVFDVMENGRGPHVESTLTLAADGTLASLDAHGHHTFGTAADETFTRQGNRARWKSHEESGEREVTGPAFFVPITEVPSAGGLLAEAVLKAGGTLPLLPGGEARGERVGDATVKANGQERHLVNYAIRGLDLVPQHYWMNDDGTWFGVVSPWFSLVPEGWEAAIAPLQARQDQIDRDRDVKLAQATAHTPPPAGLAYVHARVLDVERGVWRNDQTVVVTGKTIASVGPAATAKPPAGAEIVDLAGKALLPGLWDMHAHTGDPDGALNLGSGVTTARDVGNEPDKLDDYKKRYDDGTAVGPHLLRFGFIEGRGEKAASSTVTAETEAEAKAAVELFAKRGYEGIKIYNSVKPELVPVLAKEAHARGMQVIGHIPVHMLANEAVRAGYDGIEHINMVLLNFLADHDTDTRTTARFSLVADRATTVDLKGKAAQDFFALLREKKTVVDPTLVTFEPTLIGVQGKIIPGTEWMVERLPVQTQRAFLTGGLPIPEGKEQARLASWEHVLATVKALHDAKVTLVVGTDYIPGLSLHRELELFVRVGLTSAEALRAATIVPAREMKRDKKSGSIAAGKDADLVVVDGDPLARIGDVRNVVSTMRGGVVFPANALLASVGVRPQPR